ncbi:hypothetical protein PFICI_00098 [Pestalotiopsis fici W106-1]|uniref:Major facilitator superfamily (MFS) profile domain-containing protein n=1 Tax=Pestalotiopsis fici (strain W106-1 / CGMCC3.15140) TaxID=1229662 RepID=W3XJU6_PESFW|nr:uncharacterized protein PFICI_00098 [Pestalotiopsis fici W106-1]ETS86270.1 hypothetical protein PFICI_00098 [Pestalotiopsis fici W106-1]
MANVDVITEAGPEVENKTGVLDPEHRDYLLSRHKTLELHPFPSRDPADPLNWPDWKKNLNLFLIAFHAMMTTFIAAGIIPAYELFVRDFGITISQASYLTSAQVLILGLSPLFWKPVSDRWGRRPIWLISTSCSMICNIGCAESRTYAAQVVTRILVAFFISPAIAISSVVVAETFFAENRGQKMGIWTLMVTLGAPTGPFLLGFVAYATDSWKWIYWIFAITNGVQCIAYFIFSPETLFAREGGVKLNKKRTFWHDRLNFRLGGQPHIVASDFVSPLKLASYPHIVIPAVAYAIVFNFASILATVEIPQIFTPKFEFNVQQIGLQFIGIIVGSLVGEVLGGLGSDQWMRYQHKRNTRSRKVTPEDRLWVDRLQSYNVTPVVGLGIAAFGNQVISTVLVTYAVDCHDELAASIGVFINFVRSTWGFIGPFWFPYMFSSIGLSGSGGLMAGIIAMCAILPIMFIHWKGRALRKK